jgi:hypothetical protein
VGLDRPAKPPDRPTPEGAAEADPSPDPWGVESLTRAQAYESLRAQAAASGAADHGTTERRDEHALEGQDRTADSSEHPADRPPPREPESSSSDPYGISTLTRAQAFESLRAKADQQDDPVRVGLATQDSGAPLDDQRSSSSPEGLIDQPEQALERPRDYWTEVPRFYLMWRDHTDRWPRTASHDQLERAEGTGFDDANIAAERITQAETDISASVERIAGNCSSPTRLGGFEFRLKGADRIKEKVADRLGAEPDRSPAEIAQEIPDAIRYTYCFDTGDYTNGCTDVRDRLKASGYEMYYSKNSWSDPEYKGVNSRWITPEGQRFEVQFHTPESFHAKHDVTHQAYERIRDPTTTEHERTELRGFQREVSRWVPIPAGARDISDYKREGF